MSASLPAPDCAVCGEPGRACSQCRVDAYCGPAHQKQDWKRHRAAGCGSVKLEGGRLRAVKDIAKGTVLIKDSPAVIFPDSNKSGALVCVGCCGELPTGTAALLQCAPCGLPLCSEYCKGSPLHQDECGVFQRTRYKMKKRDVVTYSQEWPWAVATLRTVLAERRDPRLAALPTDFTVARPELKVTPDTATPVLFKGAAYSLLTGEHGFYPKVVKARARVVQWLRKTVGITWLSEQQLLRAATLVDVHSHGVGKARPGGWQTHEGRIYLGISQLEHSCMPNTAVFPFKGVANPRKEDVMVAARDIKAGEFLSKDFLINGWMEDTLIRQNMLLYRFGFVCRCQRCEDVTELGEYVGSPFCPLCAKKGQCHYVIISKDPKVWVCEGCGKKTSMIDEEWTTDAIARQDKLEKEGADYKQWLAFLVSVQHPNGPLHGFHSIVIKAKDSLRRSIYQRRADLNASRMELKVWEDMCRVLLEAMDKLCPGMHEHRLQILLELRRLILKHINDAADELERVGAPRSPSTSAQADLAKLISNPNLASGEVNEAMKKRLESMKLLKKLDEEFSLYIFGFEESVKQAMLYQLG